MRASTDLLNRLNELLGHELASSELYLAQSWVLKDQGYEKIATRLRHESDDERSHAEKLIERILYLGGQPDLTKRPALEIGTEVHEMLKNDLSYEIDIARMLNEIIAMCHAALDAGTRTVLDQLLFDTEMDHIVWLESQLRNVKDMGIENYLAGQIA